MLDMGFEPDIRKIVARLRSIFSRSRRSIWRWLVARVDLKGLAAGAADLGRGPKDIRNLIFSFSIKSAFSGDLTSSNHVETL